MAVIYIIALLFIVSNVCANSEDVLSGNETSFLDSNVEVNITKIVEAFVPNVHFQEEEENSTANETAEADPLLEKAAKETVEHLIETDLSLAKAVNETIEQSISQMKSQVLIGETECDTSEVCQSIKSSECKSGVCECLETHVPSLNNSDCLKIATESENQCEIDMQCKTFNSKCLNQKCVTEEIIKKTSSAVSQSEHSQEDNGAVSGTRIYLSLLVVNCLFLIYN